MNGPLKAKCGPASFGDFIPRPTLKTRATPEAGYKECHSYKRLPAQFRRDGFNYRQIAREGNAAIYEQTWSGCRNSSVCYEVIRIRHREGFQIGGRFVEAAEVFSKIGSLGRGRVHAHGQRRHVRKAAGDFQVITVPSTTVARWLNPNFELIEAVAHTGNGLVDLWEASPIRLNSNKPNTDEIIDILFPGNPLLCCGWTRYRSETRPRTRWYKLEDLQFIVPNPTAAPLGLTQQHKKSYHALSNTGPRRFLIVEFDFDASNSPEEARLLERLATEGRDVRDLCSALLLHLAEKAPLVLVVYSGGESLHGWFYCAGVEEQRVCRFFRYAVALAADRTHWNPSQFARMPDGLREKRNRQAVYFFNPAVLK